MILKRYLFYSAPYLKQSTLFLGNFIQIASESTENGFLLEINASLRGILLIINTSLRGILSPRQRLCPRNLKSSTCLCLQFLKKES